MPTKAKYIMSIPTEDNHGNPLKDIATFAHNWLTQVGIDGSYIERNKDGNWRDDPQEKFDHLVTISPDEPKTDGLWKQLAKQIAEITSQWAIYCWKEGKNGISDWMIDNPNVDPKNPPPAENIAIASTNLLDLFDPLKHALEKEKTASFETVFSLL